MSNLDFQLLESYLFAENKQDFISKLVPGTEAHYFFSILHNIHTSPNLDKSIDQTNDYNRRFGGYTPQNLKLRALLQKFDEPATTKQDKDSIIEELTKDYLRFNFNYPKPADIMTSNLHQASSISSTLDPASVSLALEIEKVYNSVNEFSMLQQKAYTRLNTEKIVNGDINVFEKFIFSAEPTDFPDFPDLIILLMKKKKNENASYIYRLLPQLSKEQLIELSKINSSFMEDSEFVQALCKKEFEITSLESIGEDLPKQERRDLLFKFYTWVKENLTGFPNLASNALYEILQLDLEMNKFSKDLFIEYLKNPITHYNAMPKPLQNALTQRQAQQKMRDFANRRIYPDELITTYLEVFFRDSKDTQPFNEYFESPFLNSIFYTTKLVQGEPLDSHGVLEPEKLKALSEMKELKICGYNKQFYKTGDQVNITVSIKNIPSLTVKVFEFKAENYYLKEKKQLDGSINLDGLIAAEEYNYDFSEPPIQRFTKEFTFPSISEKTQCIFIIDFIGNGLSSRAVIRKGKLAFIEYQTLAGQLFEIVDDATNICKGKRTGIWIKDRFYKADDKGRILVPYSSNSREQAVLAHDNMAELVDIDLREEKFEFKCSYIYNYESFLMGNKAKVLVQPRLFINGQPTGLDVIHECSAIVTTINDEGIPSRNTFNNVKLSVAEEIELEFGIPAKLAEVNIQIKAKIFPVNKREPKEYTSQHVIPIELHKASNSFYNIYLRYTKNGYKLVVLGKTGESKQGLTVNLTLNHKYINRKFVQSLQTDKDGRIVLGKLEDITLLMTELQSVGDTGVIKRGWKLNNQKKINYPENIRICQGDEIALPLGHNELSRHKVLFSRILPNKEVIRNELKSLKIDKRRLVISGLEEGLYRLYLKDIDQEISITVYKGKYWEQNENFLYTDHTLIDTKQDTDSLIIGDIKVQPKQDSELADITIEAYADYPQRARFHVFAAQFMDPDMNRVVDDMNKSLPEHNQREAFLGLRGSQFINNRSLGDEYTYVLDRKNQARFMGNTLEKPQILLKKTFVRDTQTTEEQLAGTQQFEAVEIIDFKKSKKKKHKKEMRNDRGFDDFSSDAVRFGSTGDNFLNFLANPCLIYNNLKMDKEGLITLKDFPYKKYSLLQIVGSNLSSNVSEIFPLEGQDIQVNDLAQKLREGDSVFSVSRVSTHLPKGEKIQIKDLTSTEIQVMDSIAKLFTAQKNLALGSSAQKVGETYDTWEFLTDWEGLSTQEKLKKYDKFASHELNVFLYFKDRDFYNKVVLPFLQNKIEKTVVNYFLLNDDGKMRHYAQAGHFQTLNPLEKILVILNIQRIDLGQAKSLAASLENEVSFRKVDSEQYNRFFDTVLLSKKVEKEQIEHHVMRPQAYNIDPFMCKIEGEGVDLAAYGIKKGGMLSKSRLVLKEKKAFDSADYFKEKTSQEIDDLENREFLEKRAQIQVGFQELEKTKEYTERQYYEQANKQVLFELNSFWVDVAKHIIDNGFTKPFISSNLLFAHSNHTEMISVLSLISLPFKAGNHKQSSFEGRGLELQAESELLIFSKAVIKTEAEMNEDILIRQRFFDPQDRYTESQDEPGLLIDKEVDQYIINKVYSSTVSVTNSSSYRQQVQVLVEIPEGSLPVKSLDYTKSYTSTLDAFGTRSYESLFYFPKPGKFSIIPPNISKKGKVIVLGKKSEIEVKTEKTYASLETLTAILNKGSKDDILSFVKTRNIWNPKVFDFSAIYWLLTDKEFFLKFVEILRERKDFNSVVWQFGFYHKDELTIKEYFSSLPENTITSKFLYIDSSLLKVDNLKLLEYSPFVNKRAHVLADAKNRILNVQLKEQYKTFLTYLCEHGGNMKTEHLLGLVYYLLLQDRVQDAIKLYGTIDREEVRKSHQFELQYDYLSGYIDFYIGAPKFAVAREICQKYLDYPVLSWRSMFVEIKNQLAEYDGEKIIENEAFSEEKKQNMENADKEETVSMGIHQTELHVNHQNVREITLAFYRIDLEVLFSRSPFISQNKMEFSYIQANETKKIEISNPKGLEKTVFEIPQGLRNYNLYIELRTENKVLSTTYFSTSLQIQIIESYGQVKVLDKNNKPLSHVYVKCFAKDKSGKESFYKDGYTDLRGRFDYATLNSSDISNIQRFAIFVMSDEYGSLIREASPPNQLGRFAV